MMISCGRILTQQPAVVLRNFCRIGQPNVATCAHRQSTQPELDQKLGKRHTGHSAGTVAACPAVDTETSRKFMSQPILDAPALLPAIDLIVGPMFAGKSTELLHRVKSFEAAGHAVLLLKSRKDDRYHQDRVVTHDGLHKDCVSVQTLGDFRSLHASAYQASQVIAIDEAQFFPDLLEFCTQAADRDAKVVLVAGLDGDFRRQQFGQVLDLLPVADTVTKLASTCKFCASAARFSLRIAADERQEVVGGAEKYAPVCRRHYVELSDTRK